MSRIVLTGGPGAGKTSIIDILATKGYNIIPEPARTIIEHYKKNSPELLPALSKENRNLFQIAIEKTTINDYLNNQTGFFDRSILDEIGYRNRYNVSVSVNLDKAAKEYRYNKVFIFPFWEEIYKNDDVRHETAEEAKIIYEFLHKTYVNYGYSPIIVPKMDVNKRVDFILNNI